MDPSRVGLHNFARIGHLDHTADLNIKLLQFTDAKRNLIAAFQLGAI